VQDGTDVVPADGDMCCPARYHGCKLLNISVLPVMPPDPANMKETHEASRFRSFAAGYLKRELGFAVLKLFAAHCNPRMLAELLWHA
jgi:hypothetical protein